MPVSWLKHRGYDILHVDYRGLGPDDCIATLREQSAAIEVAPGPVLTLVDVRGAGFGGEFMRVAKLSAEQNTKRTRKRAVVGAEGLKELLLRFFNVAAGPVPMKPFETIEEALDYLVEP